MPVISRRSLGTASALVALGASALVAPASALAAPAATAAKMTLSAPGKAKLDSSILIKGTLRSHTGAKLSTSGTITATVKDRAGTHTYKSPANSHPGTFSFPDKESVAGKVVYTFSYRGNGSNGPVSKSTSVAVHGKTPSLSIKTNHKSYNYGHVAAITIHLGATHGNRKVTLIAVPYGHKRVSETHKVGGKGNFSDTFGKLDRTTTFYAHFAGDTRYAARTVKVVRKVHAKIVTERKGGYATKHGYRYVHTGKKAYYSVGIAPNKAKQHLTFTLQRYSSGSWHTIQKKTETLNKKSITGVSITASAGSYRVRAHFKGGKINPAANSKYGYFRFV